jgi:hypothetical protein
MLANEYLLQIISKRIEFWRAELQAAFRNGNAQQIADCTRLLEEYLLLTAQAPDQHGVNDGPLPASKPSISEQEQPHEQQDGRY